MLRDVRCAPPPTQITRVERTPTPVGATRGTVAVCLKYQDCDHTLVPRANHRPRKRSDVNSSFTVFFVSLAMNSASHPDRNSLGCIQCKNSASSVSIKQTVADEKPRTAEKVTPKPFAHPT